MANRDTFNPDPQPSLESTKLQSSPYPKSASQCRSPSPSRCLSQLHHDSRQQHQRVRAQSDHQQDNPDVTHSAAVTTITTTDAITGDTRGSEPNEATTRKCPGDSDATAGKMIASSSEYIYSSSTPSPGNFNAPPLSPQLHSQQRYQPQVQQQKQQQQPQQVQQQPRKQSPLLSTSREEQQSESLGSPLRMARIGEESENDNVNEMGNAISNLNLGPEGNNGPVRNGGNLDSPVPQSSLNIPPNSTQEDDSQDVPKPQAELKSIGSLSRTRSSQSLVSSHITPGQSQSQLQNQQQQPPQPQSQLPALSQEALSLENPPQPLFTDRPRSSSSTAFTSPPFRPSASHLQSSSVAAARTSITTTAASSRPPNIRSFSENIRAEREDLREAAEHTRNVILDLGLDGRVKWVSPSWTRIIGTLTKGIEGCDVKDILVGDKEVFDRAVEELRRDDSRSQMVRVWVRLGPLSVFWREESLGEENEVEEKRKRNVGSGDQEEKLGDNKDADGESESTEKEERSENILQLEGQGIMVFDRFTGQESHTMWMLRPPVRPREITIDLPPILVESLGVGAEVLANYLTMLAEAGGRDPAHHPPPMPVLCRICERQITPWWFEKHSELCITEHKAEMEVQIAHESLGEHRRSIVKVLDALEARGARPADVTMTSTKGEGGVAVATADAASGSSPSTGSGSGSAGLGWESAGSGSDTGPGSSHAFIKQAEYKGLPIGTLPSGSESNSTSVTPASSRDPSRSRSRRPTLRTDSKSRSSFAPRRPLTRIVELILDLCDTALEINVPTLKEPRTWEPGEEFHFRTDSPQSDSRIAQVMQWQSPSSNTLEQEAGLAELANDTEQAARAKVDAVRRHRRIIEYAERIRVEFAVLIEQCITAAVQKAEKIAAGELSDSSEASSESGRGSQAGSEYDERAKGEQEWRAQWKIPGSEGRTPTDAESMYECNTGEAFGKGSMETTVGYPVADDQRSIVERPVSRPVSSQSRLSQISSFNKSRSPAHFERPISAAGSLPPPISQAPTSVPSSISGMRSHSNSLSVGMASAPSLAHSIAAPQPTSRPVFLSEQAYESDRGGRPPSAVSCRRSPSPFEYSTPRSQPIMSAGFTLGMSNSQFRNSRRSIFNGLDASPGTIPADALLNMTSSLPAATAATTLPPNANIAGPTSMSSGQGSSGCNSNRNSANLNSLHDHTSHSSALSSAIAAARLAQSPEQSEGSVNSSHHPSGSISLGRSTSHRREKRQSIKLPGLISSSSPRRESPGRTVPHSPLISKPRLSIGESLPSPTMSSPLLPNLDTMSGSQYGHQGQHGLSTSQERNGGETGGSQSHSHSFSSAHHRRQSSSVASPDFARSVPISPRLAASNYPPQKAVAPSIKDFEIIKPISKGAFGSVYLSRKKSTGEYFAIKVLKKADMVAKNQISNVKAERAIMMWQGESEFVAKLYWTFSSKEYLYLVMEYLNGGDCASLVKTLGGLPEDWAKKYIAEVVLGVEHLHDRGIVHRDLKPDNLLIDQKGHLKLTDFGLSRMGLVGRQKRIIKSGNHSAPDLLRQGPFMRPSISTTSSRSASVDLQVSQSPTSTPGVAPVHESSTSLPTPSYFALNRETQPVHIERPRRSSGHRSDSVGSESLSFVFRNSSLTHLEENSPYNMINPMPPVHVLDDDMYSETCESPKVLPLHHSTSHSSSAASGQYGTPPRNSTMVPPPMALFDAADHGRGFVGTPDYLAPETIKGSGQDEMCDWWSLGCILFEFLFGYPPFNADTPDEVFDNILNRNIHWPAEADEMVTPEAKDLMNKLMTTNPKERLGSNKDDIYKNGGEEVRAHSWFSEIIWTTLLEDKAQFTPAPENPEDTEYFDARGATLQSFQDELEDSGSPPPSAADYQDRPHDALTKIKCAQGTNKRGLLPLSIPPHVRDRQNRRHSEAGVGDDFGSFTFKNLPVLEKANKDVIQKLKQEALQTQQRQYSNATNPPIGPPSVEGSPLLSGSLKRTISKNKRSTSPSAHSQATSASPSRPSQPSSPLYVQFSTGNHDRRKLSSSQTAYSGFSGQGSNSSQDPPRLPSNHKIPQSAIASPSSVRHTNITTPSTEKLNPDPFKNIASAATTRSRSHTLTSQEGEMPSTLKETPYPRGHHKRRSQLFDVSPSSSDNEDPRAKALLKVQRRRQSSRRMSQFNLDSGPYFRSLDVLICEDHPVSRIVMERLFEKLRCRIITAINGSEAMRYALSEVQFDVIMTEFKLPQINGYDVARMIRETKSVNTYTPIVAVTGYLKEFPETHNFDALIEKPPTLAKFIDTLSKLCHWKPPPKDLDYAPPPPLQSPALRQVILQSDDPPSSACSSTNPATSSRGIGRADSIGSRSSYGYFTDMEPSKSDESAITGAVNIPRRNTDDWSNASSVSGLGLAQHVHSALSMEQGRSPGGLIHHALCQNRTPAQQSPSINSSSPASSASGVDILNKKLPIIDTFKPPRDVKKNPPVDTTADADLGDEEDKESTNAKGNFESNSASPQRLHSTHRPSSKLGVQMLRTNSHGSVVSAGDEHAESQSGADGQTTPLTRTVTGTTGTSLESNIERLAIVEEKLAPLHEHDELEEVEVRDDGRQSMPGGLEKAFLTPTFQISTPTSPPQAAHPEYSSPRAEKSTPPTLRRSPDSSSSLPDYDKEKTPKATRPRHPSAMGVVNDQEGHAEHAATPRSASTTDMSESRPSSSHIVTSAEGETTQWPDW
ncbi:rim15, signal transduction response regulator [Ascosphaera aggregata]|nr:rim15, signal transduction response regulator [Ascosphaera aggregata]